MNAYVFATGNSWDATTNQVSKINMNTESNAGAATSMSSSKNRASAMGRDFSTHTFMVVEVIVVTQSNIIYQQSQVITPHHILTIAKLPAHVDKVQQ